MKEIVFLTLILAVFNSSILLAHEVNHNSNTPNLTSEQQQILKKVEEILTRNEPGLIIIDRTNINPGTEAVARNFKNDEEVIKNLIKVDGLALKYATLRLRNDKSTVLEAVKQNGLALEFASPTLQRDKDVISAAATENIQALEFVPKSAINDKNFILQILKSQSHD